MNINWTDKNGCENCNQMEDDKKWTNEKKIKNFVAVDILFAVLLLFFLPHLKFLKNHLFWLWYDQTMQSVLFSYLFMISWNQITWVDDYFPLNIRCQLQAVSMFTIQFQFFFCQPDSRDVSSFTSDLWLNKIQARAEIVHGAPRLLQSRLIRIAKYA